MSCVCHNHLFPFKLLPSFSYHHLLQRCLPLKRVNKSTSYSLSLSLSLLHFDVHSESTMENPNSLQEEAPSVFTAVPSPLLGVDDDTLLSYFVPPQYHEINARGSGLTPTDNFFNTDTIDYPTPPNKRSDVAIYPNPKKNTSTRKKDRHSKICTAQGLRARRMRLSVQIAQKFFDLQDLLGFDKASKTIEWLFAKSTSAIRELGSSVMEEAANHKASMEAPIIQNNDKKDKNSRKSAYSYLIGNKESRDKARARARERTREKMFIRSLERYKQCYVEGTRLSDLEAANQLFPHSHEKNSTLENFVAISNSLTSHSALNFQNNIRAMVSDGEDSSNNFVGIFENLQKKSE